MKLDLSAILDTWSYEEMMDFASEHGFECRSSLLATG